jgi:WD40 repeat protein
VSQRVFICYARVDQSFALPLAEQLKARGVSVFVDQWDIPAERDWDRSIDSALRECARLLIVLSPASVDSREVRGELRTALDLGKPILPVLYQPCEIPRQLRIVQFVDFTGRSPGDAAALNEVLRALSPVRADDPEPPPEPPAPRPPRVPSRAWGLRHLSMRAKAAVAAALVLLLGTLAWFAVDMALEPRRRLNDAALSPDGLYMATVTGQGIGVRGALRVWEVGSGRQAAFVPIDGPAWVCAWSPDGKKLAVGTFAGSIQVYDTGAWRRSSLLSGPRELVDALTWSPDGAAIATGDSKGSLWVWDVATGALRFSEPVHTQRIDAVTWTRDSTQIATGGWDHSVVIVDARDGRVVRRLEGHASFVGAVAFSPDGERLASGSLGAPFLIVWDLAGAGTRHDLDGPRNEVGRVEWSSDGRYLASTGKDSMVHVWDATRLEYVRRFTLTGRSNSGLGLAWSPDGRRLAAGDASAVYILDPARDAPLHALPEPSDDSSYGSVEIAGWSTDGRRLGTFSQDGRTSGVWDVDSATRLQTFGVGLWRSLIE